MIRVTTIDGIDEDWEANTWFINDQGELFVLDSENQKNNEVATYARGLWRRVCPKPAEKKSALDLKPTRTRAKADAN